MENKQQQVECLILSAIEAAGFYCPIEYLVKTRSVENCISAGSILGRVRASVLACDQLKSHPPTSEELLFLLVVVWYRCRWSPWQRSEVACVLDVNNNKAAKNLNFANKQTKYSQARRAAADLPSDDRTASRHDGSQRVCTKEGRKNTRTLGCAACADGCYTGRQSVA